MEPKFLDVVALSEGAPEHPVIRLQVGTAVENFGASLYAFCGRGAAQHRPAEKIFPSTSTKLPPRAPPCDPIVSS